MQRVLRISFVATLCYTVLAFIAGWHAQSLALISEAGHNASDALALILSFVAVYFQGRPPNDQKTFGYQRAGVLVAFLNALALIGISIWLTVEAVYRFEHPHAIEANIMMIVAAAGVVMNGVIAAMLWSTTSHDVNIRSVFIHMLGDTLSTAAVILGGLAILYTRMDWIDPALSIAIAAMIFLSSFGIVRETLNILLEGAPRGISLDEIRKSLIELEGVEDVHDLHVWSLGSNSRALATHIIIADIPPSESNIILDNIRDVLRKKFRIQHSTVQFENAVCDIAETCAAMLEADALHDHGPAHDHVH